MSKQEPIPVTGVWLRKLSGTRDIEVLVETGGVWRRAITDKVAEDDRQTIISHIVEPLGIMRSPEEKKP